jgi:hypothetical protein
MAATGRLAAALAALALLGCGAGDGDAPSCADDTEDWWIVCPAELTFRPGQALAARVERVDVVPEPIFLYVLGAGEDGGDVAMAIPVVLPVAPDADDVDISMPVPPIPDGRYRLAIGDADGARSNVMTIDIETPAPRYSQAEAAQVVQGGLDRLLDLVDDTVFSDDPDWAEASAQLYQTGQLDGARARIDELRMVVGLTEESYMALPADAERTLQCYYDEVGLLPLFESLQADPDWPNSELVQASFVDTIHEPMHRLLVTGDTISWGLEAFGFVADVEVIVTLLFPGAQPLAAVGMEVKLVLEVVKFIIDTFLPTDLKSVEVHGSSLMFDGEPAAFRYWGEFGPENDGQGAFSSLDGLIIEGLSRAIPGPKATDKVLAKALTTAKMLLETWATRLGLQLAALSADEGVEIVTRVKVRVDMGAYRVPLLERLASVPGLVGAVSWIAQKLINSFDLVDAVELENITPAFATSVMVDSGDPNRLEFSGMAYPAGSPETTQGSLYMNAEGYSLGGEDVLIFTIPRWTSVRGDFGPVAVQKAPDSTNPNQLISDESYIFDWIDPAADPTYLFIQSTTTTERSYVVNLTGAAGFIGGELIDIHVNGTPQVTGATTTFNISVPYTLQLKPGRNEITFVNRNPEMSSCSTGEAGGMGCLIVGFPYTVNFDKTTTIVFSATDGSRTFEVWTPPAVGQ